MATSSDRIRPRSRAALQIESMLKRYPRLEEAELERLIELFVYLPVLDQALLTTNDQLAPKLAVFLKDHGSRLKAPRTRLLTILALPGILAACLLWLIIM